MSIDRRSVNLQRLREEQWDVLIAGGGINGAGIARDLMLRGAGLRVALIDKGHFASGASGRNSQLIHGGLRYLKYLDFSLVRQSLRERTTLLRIAPGLVEPLEFLIPCYSARERFIIGAGLTLYDKLAGRNSLGAHRSVDAHRIEPELAHSGLRAGLMFHDCRMNSARLVLANLLDAEARGAAIANYVEMRFDAASGEAPPIEALDKLSGERFRIRARRIVNATGAWSKGLSLRLVRGSHLIFPRIQKGSEAIAHFDERGRVVFLIPWGETGNLTLVGTTEVDHEGSPDDVRISEEETQYLTSNVRRLFPEYRGEPVAHYSALRSLAPQRGRTATATSRGQVMRVTQDGMLHVAGGKYTTYRAISEEAVDILLRDLAPDGSFPCRTAETPLPIETIPADPLARVRVAVEREYARKLADVLYISTYWGYEKRLSREWLEPIAREMAALLGWNDSRVEREIAETCV